MTVSSWLCVLLATSAAGGSRTGPQTPGLSVRDGVLLKDGVRCRAIGVNYFDAFARTLHDPNDTSYDAGLRVLAEHGIPFARFLCGGFWPTDMKLYLENKARYFELLNGVVRAAEKHGVGLIPSLFWYLATVPDLVGEPCDQWGNPASKTHAFMRTYTREVVTRYLGSPAIWGWEFGNEYNLAADLPNAKEHLPLIVPKRGTPSARSDRDILTHEMIRTALREFAREVRRHDRQRIIVTGNSIPRPSAWHQMHEGTWAKDSPEQFAQMLAGDNPDPLDTLSIHVYEEAADRLGQALEVARKAGKPLFVGEFGVSGEGPEATQQFESLLRRVEASEAPLAALWVYDYRPQAEWTVRSDNNRSYQLAALAAANQRPRQAVQTPASLDRQRHEQIVQHDSQARGETVTLPAEVLRDKIRGGLLGQILGNLNGLEHEMKYIAEPGNVTEYQPALPQGAWTDDDTDFEWVYIKVMQDEDCLRLPPERISRLWRERINKRIWCSNQYARQLMDLGIEPPLTGSAVFNPWADFNISGQFLCETFGLLAPALPQQAARIGLNYTRVAIDGEPAQTTQLFTSMIALAFVEDDIDTLLDHGLAALDPGSVIAQIVKEVRNWHRQYPSDWRTTRRLLQEKYSRYNGEMRDRNGHELNTGAIIAALLYGEGDFVRTLMTAFNFGWDADCNAATAGTIIGARKGYRWMLAQGWPIVDRYKNTTRENMPTDETITSFADRLVDLAERVILEQGGQRQVVNGRIVYRVSTQKPACIQRMEDPGAQTAALREKLLAEIKSTLAQPTSKQALARAAYYAICLDLAPSIRQEQPQQWSDALAALNTYPNVVQVIFHQAPTPLGD
ncbi:MAG: ADP-ribosylglycohydrolase family protein, partial [Planctomycetes bacterium]|nr:ADP-ribosylglycohydrolase family protein [Planctomycetota bacterium]